MGAGSCGSSSPQEEVLPEAKQAMAKVSRREWEMGGAWGEHGGLYGADVLSRGKGPLPETMEQAMERGPTALMVMGASSSSSSSSRRTRLRGRPPGMPVPNQL